MTDLDTDLHGVLDRALTDLETPTRRIQEGAVARGRALRRRRRAVATLGSIAAAALVATVALPSLAGTDDAGNRVAHESTDTDPTLYQAPPGWWDMPSRVMRHRLDSLLGPGLTVVDTHPVEDGGGPGKEPNGGWLQVDLAEDGAPAGGLNVLLYPPAEDGEVTGDRVGCPGNLEHPTTCTELVDRRGEVVGRSARWRSDGVVVLEVTLVRPGGGLVYAAASNSSDDKWGQESSTDREHPPLTLGGLRDLAADPTWQDWSAAAGSRR